MPEKKWLQYNPSKIHHEYTNQNFSYTIENLENKSLITVKINGATMSVPEKHLKPYSSKVLNLNTVKSLYLEGKLQLSIGYGDPFSPDGHGTIIISFDAKKGYTGISEKN